MPANVFFREMFIEWKNILIKPNKTLSRFKARKLSKSTLYILLAGFFAGILYDATHLLKGEVLTGVIVITPLVYFVTYYIFGFVLWIIGKLFKTKTSLTKWLSLFFAAMAPLGVLKGIPYVMYLAELYCVYIAYLAVRNFLKLSVVKSIIVVVIYNIVVVIPFLIFYL